MQTSDTSQNKIKKLIDKSNLEKYSEYRVLLNENEIKDYLVFISVRTIYFTRKETHLSCFEI